MVSPSAPWVPYLDGIVRDRREIAELVRASERVAASHQARGEQRDEVTVERILNLARWA
jgi:hypothetical protein